MLVTQLDRRVQLDKTTNSVPYTQHYNKMTNMIYKTFFLHKVFTFKRYRTSLVDEMAATVMSSVFLAVDSVDSMADLNWLKNSKK